MLVQEILMEIIDFYFKIVSIMEMMLYKQKMLQLYQEQKIYPSVQIHLIQLYQQNALNMTQNMYSPFLKFMIC
jgi:hypothetical protein